MWIPAQTDLCIRGTFESKIVQEFLTCLLISSSFSKLCKVHSLSNALILMRQRTYCNIDIEKDGQSTRIPTPVNININKQSDQQTVT